MGQTPAINAAVYLSPDEQTVVAKKVVALSRRITGKNIDGFISGRNQLACTQLRYNGNCVWAYHISISTVRDLSHRESPPKDDGIARRDTTFYACPGGK